jgi:hypothetical protein
MKYLYPFMDTAIQNSFRSTGRWIVNFVGSDIAYSRKDIPFLSILYAYERVSRHHYSSFACRAFSSSWNSSLRTQVAKGTDATTLVLGPGHTSQLGLRGGRQMFPIMMAACTPPKRGPGRGLPRISWHVTLRYSTRGRYPSHG